MKKFMSAFMMKFIEYTMWGFAWLMLAFAFITFVSAFFKGAYLLFETVICVIMFYACRACAKDVRFLFQDDEVPVLDDSKED